MDLPPLQQRFVMHFGEMGARWGGNRTGGQIYAVLFLSDEPLRADGIVEKLGVSRSNVSMGLKELQAWKLVRLSHTPGDRRDYYATPDDLWVIVRTIAAARLILSLKDQFNKDLNDEMHPICRPCACDWLCVVSLRR